MKRSRRIAIMIGLGALAFALWLVLRGRAPDAPAPIAAPTSTPEPAPVSARAPAANVDLVFLNDVDREGSLRLEGQVVDAEDHPVAGAEITVNTNPPRTMRSEPDGSFAFLRLIGRSYDLAARAEAGFAGPTTARLTAHSEPVILKLRPAASIEIRTVGPDNAPIAGATVELRSVATIVGKTAADGRLLLTGVGAGRYAVVAWAPGYGKTYEDLRVPVPVRHAEIVARLKIGLRPGLPVAGRVVSPDGLPVAGAIVRHASMADLREHGDPTRDAVTSDADGRFRFEAIARGTVRFLATHASFAPGSSRPIQLDGVSARTDIEIRMEPATTLAGRVVSKDGAPIAWATLRITANTVGLAYDAPRQTHSDEHGEFEITGLPRREMVIVAVHESATSDLIRVDLARTPSKRDLVIVLDQTGTIAGTVVDENGVPIAGIAAWADLVAGTGGERFRRQLRGVSQELTDSSGHFAIRGLSLGSYFVYASRHRGSFAGDTRLTTGTPANAGDLNVKVVLPAEGGLEGVVLYTDGTAPPVFSIRIEKAATPFATSDGHFRITNLAVGRATVTITGPTFDPVTRGDIVITSGKPTNLGTVTVEKGRVISGHVLDPAGQPIAEAKVFAGARIFGNGAQAGNIDLNLPGARDAVMIQTTSEADGFYALHGVGINDLALMAEHEARGRSKLQTVSGSKDSSTIDLVVLPFAAVEGTVTKGGQPLADVPVTAASQSVSTSTFLVSTGQDGAFRFDHLAPDTYKVSAVTGRSPKVGFGFAGTTVTAISGKTVSLRLEMNRGATLLVRVQVTGGKELTRAIVYVMTGDHAVTNAKQVALAASSAPGFSFVGGAISGEPARVESVPAAHYTVCAIAIPNEVEGMSKAFVYLDREGARLRAACAPVEVREAPPEQGVSVTVDVPKYVPPPDGTQDPGGSGSGSGSGGSGSGSASFAPGA